MSQRAIEALDADIPHALYRPVTDEADLDRVAGEVARERVSFIAHAGVWAVCSVGFVFLNLVTTFWQEPELPARLWSIFPVLGWGIGVATHAAHALLAAPRALTAQREVLALSGLPEPQRGGLTELLDDLRRSASFVKSAVRALSPPRIDLEASLEGAEREVERLAHALLRIEEGLRSDATRRAERGRVASLTSERERLRGALEQLRVTLSNLEIDLLLLGTGPASHAHATDALGTEAALLRAAVEGAQKAREALSSDGGGASRFRRRS